MSNRTSAPGTSCSKETVLRIGFMMDHQKDYWALCNTWEQQNEAGSFAYASWLEVLLLFDGYEGSLQGRPEAQGRPGAQGFRKLAPQKSLKLQCSSKMSINSMQGNIKRSYALRTPTLARTCAIAADYSGHTNFVRQGKSPPFIFMDIGFFSKELQRNLLFCARLTWLGPSKPFLQSEHRLVGLLTGTSWDISKKSGGISALRARLSTSLDVNKANGMLTSNAQRTFCHNVTCFRTNNCCSNRSHLPECFIKAPHFLLERV